MFSIENLKLKMVINRNANRLKRVCDKAGKKVENVSY